MNKEKFLERLLNFAVRIIALANKLPKTPAGFAIAGQIIRSGTSIGANAQEAQDGVSTNDFLNKICISLKESRETGYWLDVILRSGILPKELVTPEKSESNEITAMLVSSVKTIKSKYGSR